jgi:anti-anti-sigma factor
MSVSYETDQNQREITIAVSGHFDFRLVSKFHLAYSAIEDPLKVTVDFTETDYIDSSGLGILIYLRKHFNCQKENIHLINCNVEVAKTLAIARFHKMFVIN